MRHPFFERIDRLDETITRGPTGAIFERDVLPFTLEPASWNYFITAIDSPAWIGVLDAGGVFDRSDLAPDIPVRRVLPLPASVFLKKVSKDDPAAVRKAINKISNRPSGNIQEDVAEIATKLPPRFAGEVAVSLSEWLDHDEPIAGLLPEKCIDLILFLLHARELKAALAVFRSLITISALPEGITEQDSVAFRINRRRTKLELWDYAEVIERCHRPILDEAGIDGLIVIADVLAEAIRPAGAEVSAEGETRDYSEIWLPADGLPGATIREDERVLLANTLYEGAKQLLQANRSEPSAILQVFSQRRNFGCIFDRLKLRLLEDRSFSTELVRSALLNSRMMSQPCSDAEYRGLLLIRGRELNAENWNRWLSSLKVIEQSAIEANDTRALRRIDALLSRAAEFGRPPTSARSPDKSVEEVGAPTPRMNIWIGEPESPVTTEHILSLQYTALSELIRSYVTGDDDRNRAGLMGELRNAISQDPEHFSGFLSDLLQFPLDVSEAVIDGYYLALRQGLSFELHLIVQFCSTLLRTPSSWDSPWARRRHRAGVTLQIANLIEEGLRRDRLDPSRDRSLVWSALEPLTKNADADPHMTDYSSYREVPVDSLTLSLNSTRGKAMHATVEYGLWLWRASKTAELVNGLPPEIPEVFSVLDDHLKDDPFPGVRAVYGQKFPWLMVLDKSWAEMNVDSIFDSGVPALDKAAWNAYVLYCPPYDSVFPVLARQYRKAVSTLRDRGVAAVETHPNERLAEHLVTYYWRGILQEYEAIGLLDDFFSSPILAFREHAIEFIGRVLRNASDTEPSIEVLGRLRALWIDRLDAASNDKAQVREPRDLTPFGWWFVSNRFPVAEALDRLRMGLRLAGAVQPLQQVVKRLAELATEEPAAAIECLEELVSAYKSDERLGRLKEVRAILLAARNSGSSVTSVRAERVIHRFGELGYLQFRDMLKVPVAQSTGEGSV